MHLSCQGMKITITLYGAFKTYLPSGVGETDVTPGTTVAALLDSLGVEPGYPRIVAVNDEAVDEDHVLRDGDHLEVIHAVAGGASGCRRNW